MSNTSQRSTFRDYKSTEVEEFGLSRLLWEQELRRFESDLPYQLFIIGKILVLLCIRWKVFTLMKDMLVHTLLINGIMLNYSAHIKTAWYFFVMGLLVAQ